MTTASGHKGVFFGWYVVTAAFAVLFLAYGLQFSYGLFVTELEAELGWTRAQTALPYSIYVFLYGALSAATGRATDHYGPRRVITLGAILLGFGWGGSALVQQPWHLTIALGIVAALGMSVAWVPCNATVARWFTRRRGTAVALASTGGSLGNFLVPPLAGLLIAVWGWRPTLGVLALCSALAMIVAARFMVRDPETMGLNPDGDAASTVVSNDASDGFSVSEICGTAPFLLVVAMYICSWLVVFVPFVHLPAFAQGLGHGTAAGAAMLSAIGLGGIGGRLLTGVFSDRAGRMPALYVVFLLQALAFALLPYLPQYWVLWVAAAVFGVGYGGAVTLLPPLCGDLFGRAHVASVVGVIFAVAGAPAAVGPYATGWLYDRSGSYETAFLVSAAFNLAALLLALVLGFTQRDSRGRNR